MLGISQGDMAEKLYMHRTTYNYKEQHNKFTEREQKDLYKILKRKLPEVTMDELFKG